MLDDLPGGVVCCVVCLSCRVALCRAVLCYVQCTTHRQTHPHTHTPTHPPTCPLIHDRGRESLSREATRVRSALVVAAAAAAALPRSSLPSPPPLPALPASAAPSLLLVASAFAREPDAAAGAPLSFLAIRLGWGLGCKLRRVVDIGRPRKTAGDSGRRQEITATCVQSVYRRAGDTRINRKQQEADGSLAVCSPTTNLGDALGHDARATHQPRGERLAVWVLGLTSRRGRVGQRRARH